MIKTNTIRKTFNLLRSAQQAPASQAADIAGNVANVARAVDSDVSAQKPQKLTEQEKPIGEDGKQLTEQEQKEAYATFMHEKWLAQLQPTLVNDLGGDDYATRSVQMVINDPAGRYQDIKKSVEAWSNESAVQAHAELMQARQNPANTGGAQNSKVQQLIQQLSSTPFQELTEAYDRILGSCKHIMGQLKEQDRNKTSPNAVRSQERTLSNKKYIKTAQQSFFPLRGIGDFIEKFLNRLMAWSGREEEGDNISNEAVSQIQAAVPKALEQEANDVLKAIQRFEESDKDKAAEMLTKIYNYWLPDIVKAEEPQSAETQSMGQQKDTFNLARTIKNKIVEAKSDVETVSLPTLSEEKDASSEGMTKTAADHFGTPYILYGPTEKRICPKLRGKNAACGDVVPESICRFYCLDGIVIDDAKTICGEAIYRDKVMDKFSREYVNKEGEIVGGYLNRRFEINRNVPEENKMRLKPGETRKPRPPEWGNLESRMQAMRQKEGEKRGYRPDTDTSAPFRWDKDVDQNNVEVTQAERDRREEESGHKIVQYTNKDKQENNPKMPKAESTGQIKTASKTFNLTKESGWRELEHGMSAADDDYWMNPTEEANEPQEEDVTCPDPGGPFFYNGKKIAETEEQLKEWMNKNAYFPDVWFISDHGNAHNITKNFNNLPELPQEETIASSDLNKKAGFEDRLESESQSVPCKHCGGNDTRLEQELPNGAKQYRCNGCGELFGDNKKSMQPHGLATFLGESSKTFNILKESGCGGKRKGPWGKKWKGTFKHMKEDMPEDKAARITNWMAHDTDNEPHYTPEGEKKGKYKDEDKKKSKKKSKKSESDNLTFTRTADVISDLDITDDIKPLNPKKKSLINQNRMKLDKLKKM